MEPAALDPMFDPCVQCVLDAGQASTSLLQRCFGLKYDHAARIMDEMEEQGIIGPYAGVAPRAVLISQEQWNAHRGKDSSPLSHPEKTLSDLQELSRDEQFSASLNQQESLPAEAMLDLRIFVSAAIRWLFKPIPFIVYVVCLILIVLCVNNLYPHNTVLLLENLFSTTVAFLLLRGIYELIRYLRSLLYRAKVQAKTQLHRFQEWNDTFPSVRISAAQKTPSAMDTMDGHTFEHFCADLLRENGFTHVEVTQASGDYGIDVLAEKDEVTYAIQCKCYADNVGNHAVQEAHSGAAYYGRMVPVVMTNRYFTRAAKETAAQIHVLLWDRDKLLQMMDDSVH